MLYPVYVHMGDKRHAHGVTVPDFPGCYSAADNWDELPAKIQEAIEVYCDGEDMGIPNNKGQTTISTQVFNPDSPAIPAREPLVWHRQPRSATATWRPS